MSVCCSTVKSRWSQVEQLLHVEIESVRRLNKVQHVQFVGLDPQCQENDPRPAKRVEDVRRWINPPVVVLLSSACRYFVTRRLLSNVLLLLLGYRLAYFLLVVLHLLGNS